MSEVKNVNQVMEAVKAFAAELGYTRDETAKMNFIVTNQFKAAVVKFNTSDINKQTDILRENGIVPAIRYSGNTFTGIATKFTPQNDEEASLYDSYGHNRAEGKTAEDAIRRIISESGDAIIDLA